MLGDVQSSQPREITGMIWGQWGFTFNGISDDGMFFSLVTHYVDKDIISSESTILRHSKAKGRVLYHL